MRFKQFYILLIALLCSFHAMAQLQYSDCVATYTEADFNNTSTTTKSENIKSEWKFFRTEYYDLGPRWADGGLCLGGTDVSLADLFEPIPSWYWDEKWVVIQLQGDVDPDKISFTTSNTSSAPSLKNEIIVGWIQDPIYEVFESQDGVNWTSIWRVDNKKQGGSASDLQLQPTTRYLKFSYIGNFAGIFKNITITAKQPLNTAVSPEGVGQVSKSPDWNFYCIDEQVTLSATATDPCYQFVRWSDGETSPTRTVTVECGGPTYTAIFERKSYTVTIHVNDASQGSVMATKIE